MKTQIKAEGKNKIIRNMFRCMSSVLGKSQAMVLVSPRSLNGIVGAYMVMLMIRGTGF